MAIKQLDVRKNASVVTGAGLTFDPALRSIVGGAEALVAPDIVIPIPKAAAASAAAGTALAVGNQTVVHNNVGSIVFDILSISFHTIQKVLTGNYKAVHLAAATPIANGAGTAIDPVLKQAGTLQIPSIAVAIPKTIPVAATNQSYVAAALATGGITFQTAEAAPVNHDVAIFQLHTIARLIAAQFGASQDRRRYFTILNTANASVDAIYEDRADTTRKFRVLTAKVAADGALVLRVVQTAGTTIAGATGTLDKYSGTGDAAIAWTAIKFEKYADLRLNTAVANGAGLTFDPGIVVNGAAQMPDIVIPIPKATGTVPYVPTDLTAAAGAVNVRHNNGAPQNCDILSLYTFSAFR